MQQIYELIVPETVEAVKVTSDNLQWVAAWCKGAVLEEIDELGSTRKIGVGVPGLRSVELSKYGDYVIRKRCGDFFVLEAHTFESKYRIAR